MYLQNDQAMAILGKLERYAEKEGKRVASKFNRFAKAVENTDFSGTDPRSVYEVRNIIVHLAEIYGVQWDKLDCCYDCWHYEGGLTINKYSYAYTLSYCYDYFDLPTDTYATVIPQFIVDHFGGITPETAKTMIYEELSKRFEEYNRRASNKAAAPQPQRETLFAKDLSAMRVYLFCKVVLPFNDRPYYYLAQDDAYEIGDLVRVPFGRNNKVYEAKIVSVEKQLQSTAPYPIEKTKYILEKISVR